MAGSGSIWSRNVVSGTITATTITADDLEVDSGTLSIDETNNRVGMGTTAPGTQLQVESNAPYITLKNDTSENTAGGCESKVIFEDHGNNALGQIEVSHVGSSDDEKGQLIIKTNNDSGLQTALTISEAQKVTAAGDVQVTGDIILDDGGSLKEAGGVAAITFDGSGNVTKIGQDSPSSGEFLKYDGAKWVSDAVATGSSAADDITTGDAAVTIATTAGDITLDAQEGDANIIFKGTDSSSDITALTLSMADAGAASFNAAVTVGTDLTVTGGDVSYGNGQDATLSVANTGSGTDGRDLTISAGSAPSGSANQNGGDLLLKAGSGDGTGTSVMTFSTKISGTDAASEQMRIHTDGNVGIGDAAPGTMLQVSGANAYVTLKNTTVENSDGGCETRIIFEDHGNNALGQIECAHLGSSDDEKGKLVFSTNNDSGLQTALTIDDTQQSEFAGSILVNGGSVTVAGSTPKITIGDAGAEDTMLLFDGNAQDFHVALDDTADDLVIGVGNAAGTTTAISINENAQVSVVDAFAANVAGTFGTFSDGDATPSVATGNLWKHHASAETITMFDDGIAGQVITVISTAAITYDVTGTNLKGGSTDIVTANGDVTQWCFDGTNWYLLQFMDVSADHSVIGGGGGSVTANDASLILATRVFS